MMGNLLGKFARGFSIRSANDRSVFASDIGDQISAYFGTIGPPGAELLVKYGKMA